MTFNSPNFALFLAIFGAFYALLRWLPIRWPSSLLFFVAGYIFYGTWDYRFLFLILFSTVLDYVCGLGIVGRKPTRTVALGLAAGLPMTALLLCAPIDWPAIGCLLRPQWAYDGGWADPVPFNGLFLPQGQWKIALGALASSAALGVALTAGFRCHPNVKPRYFLAASMIGNLGLLGFFKYFDFFAGSLAQMLSDLGMGQHHWALGIVLPVGISFYTFQTMSYTIDVYRGKLQPTENLLDFMAFVSFFPPLVAGPIERAEELLPQLSRHRPFNWQQFQTGWHLIGWGLFKKIFIADNISQLVNPIYNGFSAGQAPAGPAVLVATYAFAFQIYCDFSGYSDIARGLAKLMGIEMMVNFNVPYAASNPRDFWRRWHISLSTWLRDYLYISLGGNRGGPAYIYRNLMITMVLGGLWHGARANFLWWGFYQGVLLCAHRLIEPTLTSLSPQAPWPRRLFKFLCWLIFFHLMCYGWLLFRAQSNAHIVSLSAALPIGWSNAATSFGTLAKLLWFIWPLLVVQFFQVRSNNLLAILHWPWYFRATFYLILFYLTVIFGAFDVTEFIYFQF